MIRAGALYRPAGQQLPLAVDAFLHMLDPRSKRLRVRTRLAGVFLAGATIGELVLSRRLAVGDYRVRVLDGPPPDCPVLRKLLAELRDETSLDPSLTLSDWLSYLAPAVEAMTATRLEELGILRVVTTRNLRWRTVSHYYERDTRVVSWAPLRLGSPLAAGSEFEVQDALLIALVAAAGLTPLLTPPSLLEDAPHIPDRIQAVAASVRSPDLHAITCAVRHVSGAAVLASH